MNAGSDMTVCLAPRFLERTDPLAKVLAVLPAMVLLIFSRNIEFPLALIGVGFVLLAVGARLSPRTWVLLLCLLPMLTLLFSLAIALWVKPENNLGHHVYWSFGFVSLSQSGLRTGFSTALRLSSLFLMALLVGATTSARAIVLALITYLRLPYRTGYAILVGIRFIPQVKRDLRILEQARFVRGLRYRGIKRWFSYLLPLASGALGRAERVALSMDARAFGAYSTRTERDPLQLSYQDIALVACFWILTASCVFFVYG